MRRIPCGTDPLDTASPATRSRRLTVGYVRELPQPPATASTPPSSALRPPRPAATLLLRVTAKIVACPPYARHPPAPPPALPPATPSARARRIPEARQSPSRPCDTACVRREYAWSERTE